MSKPQKIQAPEPVAEAPPERTYRGCVMVREGTSWRWAEVSLPESVVQAHTVRAHTPDMKAMVVGQIENVFLSEAMATGRGWEVER